MIGYIKGSVEGIFTDYLLLENGGIGYRIFTSQRVLEAAGGLQKEVLLYTYLHVREDELSLFGFLTMEELDAFKLLIGVNGIGPKVALSVLSVLSVRELSTAVITSDVKAITKANGVGSKVANRVIMELKDKLKLEDTFAVAGIDETGSLTDGGSAVEDTVLALVSLGYSDAEALKAIRQIPDAETMDSEQLLKVALKKL